MSFRFLFKLVLLLQFFCTSSSNLHTYRKSFELNPCSYLCFSRFSLAFQINCWPITWCLSSCMRQVFGYGLAQVAITYCVMQQLAESIKSTFKIVRKLAYQASRQIRPVTWIMDHIGICLIPLN